MKIDAIGLYQHKGIKPDFPLRCYPAVQLAYTSAAKISRIFILCIGIADLLIDLVEIGIGYDGFSAKNQFSLIGNTQRNILKSARIRCNYFSHQSIAARYGLEKLTAAVGKHDRQPVQFP